MLREEEVIIDVLEQMKTVFGENRVCNSKSIRVDILEEVVWEEVKMVLKEPEVMTKVRLKKMKISKQKMRLKNVQIK